MVMSKNLFKHLYDLKELYEEVELAPDRFYVVSAENHFIFIALRKVKDSLFLCLLGGTITGTHQSGAVGPLAYSNSPSSVPIRPIDTAIGIR
jgi:hypothetical protein